jgi:hypothetical protein
MTAYTAPAYFDHADYPNAVDLNTLSTAQVHINEVLASAQQHPCAYYTTLDDYPSADSGDQYTNAGRWVVMTHTYRYLYYACDGGASRIMPYSTTRTTAATGDNWWATTWLSENATTLAETNGNLDAISVAVYDLDSLGWLTYGEQYVVYDVFGCYEYDEAHMPLESTPPFVDGNLLSAAALNSMSRNIEVIKGRMDAPVRPRLIESNDRWLFKKLAGADSLVIKGTIIGGSVNSIDIKVGTNPSSMGAALVTLNNGGSGYAENDVFDSASIDISGKTDGTDYLVEVDEDGAGTLRVEQIYTTD